MYEKFRVEGLELLKVQKFKRFEGFERLRYEIENLGSF